MKKLLAAVMLSGVVLVGAGETKVAHADGYGMAGCGLGSMLIKDNSLIMQLFAGTTNGSFGSQSWGIVSGTSNCSADAAPAATARRFIQTNREVVAKDISRGSGETITTLASIGGCTNSGAVGAKLQSSFETIFPQASVSDVSVSNNVVEVLKADPTLGCTNLN